MLRFTLPEFADYLGSVHRNANPTVARALNDEAHLTLDATMPFTPIEYGPLRASGHVNPARRLASSIEVEIVFGGAAAAYAVYVHERVVTRGGKRVFHASPTKAKFLSETADSRMSTTQAGLYARTLLLFLKGK